MQKGKVKWFNVQKGYGFITPDDGSTDVFVHYTAVDCKGFKNLKEGDAVEYEPKRSSKGLSASRVVLV